MLYSIIYVFGHIVFVMGPWPAGDMHDCEGTRVMMEQSIDSNEKSNPGLFVLEGRHINRSDIKTACELHETAPKVEGPATKLR